MPQPARDDRILVLTRLTAAIVIPFLLIAFVILYFLPEQSGQRFSFPVPSKIHAAYVAAGYLGGAWLFARVLFGRQWHAVAAGFPAVTAFTVSMLLATVLHWGRFDLTHGPFIVWLVLYVVTPVLVPWLWWRNQATDPGALLPPDVAVPVGIRRALALLGLVTLGIVLVGFVWPQLLVERWPWPLTTFSSRLLAGWHALMAVGCLVMSRERRWSAWRTAVESIWLWYLLFILGAWRDQDKFAGGRFFNWYVLGVIVIILLMLLLYVTMELRRRRGVTGGAEKMLAG